ncbi:50S ribosomal protein L31e [Candidatus Bathyarchaeota archaeon]|nr:50S ribosomal protein L31e [Candidatus Bathyarchaeota archaeon]
MSDKGEEEKTEEKKKTEPKSESDIVEERIYTVPLSKAWIMPVTKRAPRAVRILREFIRRHMKVENEDIIISNEVNEKIWSRGIEKPPRKVRIKAAKDKDGLVTVRLAEGE